MKRIALPERPDWKAKAADLGFHFHTMYGEPYWDETSAYQFTLRQIEDDLEDPSTELHGMCIEAAERIIRSQELMEKVGIPRARWDEVAESFRTERNQTLYGRFDLAYDGAGPARMLEYNADTPTSLYEAASFQLIWLEDAIEQGILPANTDQFNSIHSALVERIAKLVKPGDHLHFTSVGGSDEDFATVEYMAWCADEAGVIPHHVNVEDIGLTDKGQFADAESFVIGNLFKLYPWEDMLSDPFADQLKGSNCKFIEPMWKSVVSNKGLLPVLWMMFPGHPNLLPSFFEGDKHIDQDLFTKGVVRKPIFSREGSSVDIDAPGLKLSATDRAYDEHPFIAQAYTPLPEMGGVFPVLGTWIVGDKCVGLGMREDASRITQNLSRFKPHTFIE